MAGVAEYLNVHVTLTLEKTVTKVVHRRKRFSIERLSSDFSTPPWELHFDRYCMNDFIEASQLLLTTVKSFTTE